MFDITFLGQLVATLTSVGALLALAGVLGASAYVLSTAAMAIERLPGPRAIVVHGQTPPQTGFPWTLGTIFGLLSFVFVFATVRVGDWLGTFLFAAVLGALARSSVALASILGSRAGARLARHRSDKAKDLALWRAQKAAEFQESNRKRLQGEDLSGQIAQADAALAKLREALATLVHTRATIADKLKAALDAGGNVSLVADMVRMRDDLDARIDLGQRVLSAAEVAVAKLAYSLPLKRVVRLRPREISGLDPKVPGNYLARIQEALTAMDAYLLVIGQTREEIKVLEMQRPPPPVAEGEDSLATRALREIEIIETAYRTVRERADLVRLGLLAKDGMARVATAAGEVSQQAVGQNEEREKNLLIDDIARANQSTAEDFIGGDEHVKELAKALAQGAKAISGGDRASLGEVVEALQSMG
jgi:hypothetical protein